MFGKVLGRDFLFFFMMHGVVSSAWICHNMGLDKVKVLDEDENMNGVWVIRGRGGSPAKVVPVIVYALPIPRSCLHMAS